MTNTATIPKPSDRDYLAWIGLNLYVPVVCDVLDELGFRNQAMHHRLRPLDGDNCVIVGRAKTFRWMETDYIVESDPYGLEIDGMDSIKPGDALIHSTDAGLVNAGSKPFGNVSTKFGG